MSVERAALRVAVIMPVLNEEAALGAALRSAGSEADQVIVVDGGSTDRTVDIAQGAGARVIQGVSQSRALQMNGGALSAEGEVFLFLHADVVLPVGWSGAVHDAIRSGSNWGRFDVRLDDSSPLLAVVGAMMNLRSRLTGICTGDQAIFVTSKAWQDVGGFAEIPLMEDIEFSRRLKRCAGWPASVRLPAHVSARRWRQRGPWRTITAMWCWRGLYFLGAPPAWLHRRYYGRER